MQIKTDVFFIAKATHTYEAIHVFRAGKKKGAGMPAPLSCLGFVNV